MKNEALTASQLELIQSQVLPGELLSWVGREPRSRRLWNRMVRITLLASGTILMGYFALQMLLMNPKFLYSSLVNMLPVLTPLVLAITGVVLFIREVVWSQIDEPDLDALTTRRALVITPGHRVKVWYASQNSFQKVQVKRRKDGSGDIIFERSIHWTTDTEGRSTRQARVIGFYGLPCFDDVYRLVKEMVEPNMPLFNRS